MAISPPSLDMLFDGLFVLFFVGVLLLLTPWMITTGQSAFGGGTRPTSGHAEARLAVQGLAIAIGLGIARAGITAGLAILFAVMAMVLLLSIRATAGR
jgi:hypothetical protein